MDVKTNLAEISNKVMSKHMSKVIELFPRSKEQLTHIDLDEDKRITKIFPAFLAVCLALWVVLIVIRGEYTMSYMLQYVCLSFVICFTFLGAYLFISMNQGHLTKVSLCIMSLIMAAFMLFYGELTDHLPVADVVTNTFLFLGCEIDDSLALTLAFLFLFLVMLFVPTGVLSVTASYLRIYMAKVFLNIQAHADAGERGRTEAFFAIPDIVDVKEVHMDPEIDYENFNAEVAINLWSYIVLTGALGASYLFLNPFFLDSMSSKEMLAIMLMLSMFVPALVVPLEIIKDLNATVITDAPRPYYLWTGAKRSLLGSFLALGAFSVMFFLALYYGYSLGTLFVNYTYLLFPLACIAMMYSIMYANNFSNVMKAVIYARFMGAQEKEESGQ